jgi:glyoxalase family protein
MIMQLTGIHHVSGITADAAENLRFYTDVLGLRLVKKTVNQDDPSSYHLFFGDERGNPGTEATFFDHPYAAPTTPGSSAISNVALRVRGAGSLQWWQTRFEELNVPHAPIQEWAGRKSMLFQDMEGQRLRLVDDSDGGVAGGIPWDKSPVPAEHGIRGLGPVLLTVRALAPTERVLTTVMNFTKTDSFVVEKDGRQVVTHIFQTGEGGAGGEVHVEERPDLPPERLGRGGMHHVAFRVPDEEQYQAWLEHLAGYGIPTSGPVDRYYFRSIYFREPNGILFELATDGPGFDTDEEFEHLGETLALPPFLEPRRTQIEASVRPLETATING